MDNEKISIIVPIYNGEKYLNTSIFSILYQTYKNIEVLLINDGSKDNSLQICHELATKDSRIRVIDKPNSGVSDTRNVGIKESSGKYIMFVDCDDIIYEDCCETLYNDLIENSADISIGNIHRTIYKSDKASNQDEVLRVFDSDKTSLYLTIYNNKFKDIFYTEGPYGKIIKKDLIVQHNICFDSSLKYGEDSLFSLTCYFYASKITLTNKFVYNYIYNDSCASSGKNFNYREELYKMERAHKAVLQKLNLFDTLKDDYYFFCFRQVCKIIKKEKPNNQELCQILEEPINVETFKCLNVGKMGFKQKIKYYLCKYRLANLFSFILHKKKLIRIAKS